MKYLYAYEENNKTNFSVGDEGLYTLSGNVNDIIDKELSGKSCMLGIVSGLAFTEFMIALQKPENIVKTIDIPLLVCDDDAIVDSDIYKDNLLTGDMRWFKKNIHKIYKLTDYNPFEALDIMGALMSHYDIEIGTDTHELSYAVEDNKVECLFIRDNPHNRFEFFGLYIVFDIVNNEFCEDTDKRVYLHKRHNPNTIHNYTKGDTDV